MIIVVTRIRKNAEVNNDSNSNRKADNENTEASVEVSV